MICDQVREQPDGKDEAGASEELDLDPRIEGELDNLNKASNDINILEKELDEARALFRQRLTDAARSLKQLAKSLGSSIDKARPYFEALSQSKESQLECQNAAMTFERACEVHIGACDEISAAEDKLMHNPAMFDQAWQEMLNAANTKFMEAEKEKIKNENVHLEAALAYRELETRATQLERKLKKSVNKARPYFEQRTIYLGCLEEQKTRVQELEAAYMAAKAQYSKSLRNLEMISEDIHKVRSKNSSMASTPTAERQECVGAELTETMATVRRRLSSEHSVEKALKDHQNIHTSHKKTKTPLGRYRSSLILDLDIDIDLVENLDYLQPSKSPSAQSVDVACVAMKYYDDYQVLDIMPFLQKEKEQQRAKKNIEERNVISKKALEQKIYRSQSNPCSQPSRMVRVKSKCDSKVNVEGVVVQSNSCSTTNYEVNESSCNKDVKPNSSSKGTEQGDVDNIGLKMLSIRDDIPYRVG